MNKGVGVNGNLIPLNRRTKKEQTEITSKGGKKSVEVRQEKKRMADIYASVLAKKYKATDAEGKEIEVTGADMIGTVIQAIVSREDAASVSMIKELREGIDGNKLEHSGSLGVTIVDDIK